VDSRHAFFDLDLNLLGELALSAGVLAHSAFGSGKATYDVRDIYVAGYDYALGGVRRWVVYAIALGERPEETQRDDETKVWEKERVLRVVRMEEVAVEDTTLA